MIKLLEIIFGLGLLLFLLNISDDLEKEIKEEPNKIYFIAIFVILIICLAWKLIL